MQLTDSLSTAPFTLSKTLLSLRRAERYAMPDTCLTMPAYLLCNDNPLRPSFRLTLSFASPPSQAVRPIILPPNNESSLSEWDVDSALPYDLHWGNNHV